MKEINENGNQNQLRYNYVYGSTLVKFRIDLLYKLFVIIICYCCYYY